MSVLRIVCHRVDQLLVARDSGFGKVAFNLADQVGNLRWSQFSAPFEIPGDFLQNLIRPLRNVLSRCLSQAEKRVPKRSREENAGIQHSDKIAVGAGPFLQSELVVNAVCDGFPRHPLNRFVPALVAFFSERNQILQIYAPMSSDSMKGNLSLVKQPNEELA